MILYWPALSVVACVTFWKLVWPASSRHSTTCVPATGFAVRPPRITTLCPASDGSGEEAIVRSPGVHVPVQHVVPWVQHAVPCVQHVVVPQQPPFVGVGQQGAMSGRR